LLSCNNALIIFVGTNSSQVSPRNKSLPYGSKDTNQNKSSIPKFTPGRANARPPVAVNGNNNTTFNLALQNAIDRKENREANKANRASNSNPAISGR